MPPETKGSTKVLEPQGIVRSIPKETDGEGETVIAILSLLEHPLLSITLTEYTLLLSTNKKESTAPVLHR